MRSAVIIASMGRRSSNAVPPGIHEYRMLVVTPIVAQTLARVTVCQPRLVRTPIVSGGPGGAGSISCPRRKPIPCGRACAPEATELWRALGVATACLLQEVER